jgi:CRISPR-associated exonuclease Cas4
VELTLAAPIESSPPLTVSHILEHLYCARFTYFEYVLGVPERQERRGLVMTGRQVHEERTRINPGYLRKKLGVAERKLDVPLTSARLGVRGVVDEVLTLADGSMAPFDYKFAPAPKEMFHNQKVQSALYALLIAENFRVPVRRGFICYTRLHYKVVELPHSEEDLAQAAAVADEVLRIIQTGLFPPATRWKARCVDCCYRNICVK